MYCIHVGISIFIDIHERIHVNQVAGRKKKDASTGSAAAALYNYKATENDELSIFAGEMLKVVASHDDGWFLVQNATGSFGVVPGNYLFLMVLPILCCLLRCLCLVFVLRAYFHCLDRLFFSVFLTRFYTIPTDLVVSCLRFFSCYLCFICFSFVFLILSLAVLLVPLVNGLKCRM